MNNKPYIQTPLAHSTTPDYELIKKIRHSPIANAARILCNKTKDSCITCSKPFHYCDCEEEE